MEKMTNVKALQYVVDNFDMPTEVSEKVEAMLASYQRKAANKKPTKAQKENEGIMETLVEVLTDAEPMTATEVMVKVNEVEEPETAYTVQKISALLAQLVKAGRVTKTTDKKKSYFTA